MKLTIQEIAYHRNGVGGEDFNVVRFRIRRGKENLLAIVFSTPGQCAVLNLDLIPTVGVEFAKNSYRGDEFEDALRAAIDQQDRAETERMKRAITRGLRRERRNLS